jgi:hypothetical protein
MTYSLLIYTIVAATSHNTHFGWRELTRFESDDDRISAYDETDSAAKKLKLKQDEYQIVRVK